MAIYHSKQAFPPVDQRLSLGAGPVQYVPCSERQRLPKPIERMDEAVARRINQVALQVSWLVENAQ